MSSRISTRPHRFRRRQGASEVGRAVIASTLTTVAVFLPVVFVEGVAAQLFRDQTLTVSFSLIASLAVSLTLIPVLTALVDGGKRPVTAPAADAGRVRRVLRFVFVRIPGWVLLGLTINVVALIGAVMLAGSVPGLRDSVVERSSPTASSRTNPLAQSPGDASKPASFSGSRRRMPAS